MACVSSSVLRGKSVVDTPSSSQKQRHDALSASRQVIRAFHKQSDCQHNDDDGDDEDGDDMLDNDNNEAAAKQTRQSQQERLWNDMLSRFQGDFDNYHQVVLDRQQGKLPREGGGHEHIHCTLIPVAKDTRLAAFYFDGQPQAIFRFRFYRLQPTTTTTSPTPAAANAAIGGVDTILYTLHPQLEGQLRATANPMEWPRLFDEFVTPRPDEEKIQKLNDCEVRWSYELNATQHSYVPEHLRRDDDDDDDTDNVGIHAVMVHGQALVDSQMMPGQQILIRDQLSLWSNELWIHDRGHNPTTMAFIYGNQAGIPYQLQRVSNIETTTAKAAADSTTTTTTTTRSTLPDSDLTWTLGSEFRTETEYQAKIDAVGGPSRTAPPSRMNNKKGGD